jgi:hypothetical protein
MREGRKYRITVADPAIGRKIEEYNELNEIIELGIICSPLHISF